MMDLYTCGDCPVCGAAGDLLLVKNPASALLFVFCHNCGCAWADPPPPWQLEQVEPPDTYSPGGFVLPSEEDVRSARGRGWAVRPLETLDDWWIEILGENLIAAPRDTR
jgi:hypothetical protein